MAKGNDSEALAKTYTAIRQAQKERTKMLTELGDIARFERALGEPDEQVEEYVRTEKIREAKVDRELQARGY